MSQKKEHLKASKPIAILVDGGFFLKRYRAVYKNGKKHKPEQVAKNLYKMLLDHVKQERLYRILFYNCDPLIFSFTSSPFELLIFCAMQ